MQLESPRQGDRWRRILRTVVSFFVGQGALQAVNVLLGLFLVRALSVEAYAQFGLAYGFQTTVSNLMDLGFASTVIPLVGDRLQDRIVVGRYVRAATRLRNLAFILLSPLAVAAFVAIAYRHHWDWKLQFLLILPVLLTVYSSGSVSCHSAPFLLYRRLREYYTPQTLTALGRLGGYVVLRMAGALSSWMAVLLSALNITFVSRILANESARWVDLNAANTHAEEREIIHYVTPAIPALIFGALQSQISLFLISVFGQTQSMAEVAALSRISQLFVVLQTFNMVVVEPYIARIRREHLLATYLRLILLASACCAPVIWFAFAFPQIILALLGPRYRGLGALVGWLVLASCINYLASLVWIMNRARKWIFWNGTIFEVGLLIVVQVAYILLVGLHTTRQAVLFTFASSFCYVAAHAYNGIYGFLKGPRLPPAARARQVGV